MGLDFQMGFQMGHLILTMDQTTWGLVQDLLDLLAHLVHMHHRLWVTIVLRDLQDSSIHHLLEFLQTGMPSVLQDMNRCLPRTCPLHIDPSWGPNPKWDHQ